jgi:endonuclease/exonuclease/phosphatase family metal-dependent hydrolase
VVHTVVAHLGLIHASRVRQVQRLHDFIASHVPAGEPLLVAGDFNDWGERLDTPMAGLGLQRARSPDGRLASRLTFPRGCPSSRWTGSTPGAPPAQQRAARAGLGPHVRPPAAAGGA